MTHATFLAEVEAFLKRQGISATAFGRAAVNDPNFVSDLRGDESHPPRMPSLRLVERINAYMAANSTEAA